jgi:hypothetical protein
MDEATTIERTPRVAQVPDIDLLFQPTGSAPSTCAIAS